MSLVPIDPSAHQIDQGTQLIDAVALALLNIAGIFDSEITKKNRIEE